MHYISQADQEMTPRRLILTIVHSTCISRLPAVHQCLLFPRGRRDLWPVRRDPSEVTPNIRLLPGSPSLSARARHSRENLRSCESPIAATTAGRPNTSPAANPSRRQTLFWPTWDGPGDRRQAAKFTELRPGNTECQGKYQSSTQR